MFWAERESIEPVRDVPRFHANLFDRFKCLFHGIAPGNQSKVRSARSFSGFAERDGPNWFDTFAFRPKHMFRNEKDDRVLAMHCRPQESGSVLWRGGNHDRQSRIMRQRGFVGLTVPETATRQIGAVGSVDHHRAFPRSE